MSLINKNQANNINNNTSTLENSVDVFALESEEIAYLLQIIKNTSFKGEDVEKIYNLVIKLQNQYINKNK
jgi:hypothetical protein